MKTTMLGQIWFCLFIYGRNNLTGYSFLFYFTLLLESLGEITMSEAIILYRGRGGGVDPELLKPKTITQNGIYEAPVTGSYWVICVGGGGGGGGGCRNIYNTNQAFYGAGGIKGTLTSRSIDLNAGDKIQLTLGDGGNGGTNNTTVTTAGSNGAVGNTGGSTSFGTYISSPGGVAGNASKYYLTNSYGAWNNTLRVGTILLSNFKYGNIRHISNGFTDELGIKRDWIWSETGTLNNWFTGYTQVWTSNGAIARGFSVTTWQVFTSEPPYNSEGGGSSLQGRHWDWSGSRLVPNNTFSIWINKRPITNINHTNNCYTSIQQGTWWYLNNNNVSTSGSRAYRGDGGASGQPGNAGFILIIPPQQ